MVYGRKDKEGGQVLGHLEREVMEALWATGGASGKEVYDEIRKRRAIALTTVLTVIERLVKKGLVKKERGEAVYLFSPALTKEEFARKVSGDILRGILEISTSSASASFVDMLADTDPKELERLSELIEKKKKEISGKR